MPGLDGVRAVAVLCTLFFHATVLPGGFRGVDIFMVLSGYLITRLLLEEHREHGTINVRGFWVRRLRRLAPPLMLMLAGYFLLVVGLASVGARTDWELEVRGLVASQLYVTNWLLAFGWPVTPALQHLWSLAVEEQFYLVWAPVVMVLLRFRPTVWIVSTAALSAASIATVLLDGGFSRSYYGSDFRAHQLLIGCLLAQLQYVGLMRWIVRGVWIRSIVTVASVTVFGWRLATDEWHHTDLVTTGLPATLAAALLVAVCAMDAQNPLTVMMSWQPLRWIGARSYEIYLVHYPLCRWAEVYELEGPAVVAAIVVMSLLLGDLLQHGHRSALATYDHRRLRRCASMPAGAVVPKGRVTA
jgi:peptidoglycan/LPS O-acetylase OafA/YrhL